VRNFVETSDFRTKLAESNLLYGCIDDLSPDIAQVNYNFDLRNCAYIPEISFAKYCML
jgi:hypothetical protein